MCSGRTGSVAVQFRRCQPARFRASSLSPSGHSASLRRLFAPKSEVVCCGEGVLSVMAIFHQLGSGVPVNPFAKSELLY